MADKEKKKGRTVRRVLALALPFRKIVFPALILTLLLALISPLRPWLIEIAINEKAGNGDMAGLLHYSLIILGTIVAAALIQYSSEYLTGKIGQKIIYDLRMKVYQHLLGLKLSFHNRTPVGTMVTRAVTDIETLADLFAEGLITISGDILQIFTITAFMFYIDLELTLISLSVLPFLFYASHVFRIKVKSSFQDVRTAVARLNAFAQEHITGMHIVQQFNKENEAFRKFKKINKEHYNANDRSVMYYSVFFPVIEIITSMSLALLIWWGSKEMTGESSISFGTLTAFILYINMFFRPVRILADRFNNIQMGLVAAERIFQLLDDESTVEESGNIHYQSKGGQIVFDRVSFSYNSGELVLDDISFEALPGQSLAIVGPTGSGKSTIISLISKLYTPAKGHITIDGYAIGDLKNSELRQRVSVVLQDVFLFSGTVMDNILLNRPDISFEKVVETAKSIGADPFIQKLPNGYHFKISERGGNLSFGQRQLIAFVRALVSNPDVLILDEATSSIDTETEQVIQQAIDKMTQGRTSVVIAHRLSTIRKAKEILVLQSGKVVERGRHDDLLAREGAYFRLVKAGELVASE